MLAFSVSNYANTITHSEIPSMKAVITQLNSDHSMMSVQTDQGFCVVRVLGDYDLDTGDILDGGFSAAGEETVKNISQVEDIRVEILETGLTPFTADRMVKATN